MSELEVLVATTRQSNWDKHTRMNIQTDVVFANQSDCHSYAEAIIDGNSSKMITTPYRGVGKNRNMALLHSTADYVLFADDDMVYVNNYKEGILQAFDELKGADVIIFSCNLTKNNTVFATIQNKVKKRNIFNCFRYGTYIIAARRASVEKANIWFTPLFGGGTRYGSGEDSLFLKECLDHGLKIYTHNFLIGDCATDESTWFEGYNEKFFYDKGALCAAAFPSLKYLAAIKLAIRFKKSSALSYYESVKLLFQGIKGFRGLVAYEERNKG